MILHIAEIKRVADKRQPAYHAGEGCTLLSIDNAAVLTPLSMQSQEVIVLCENDSSLFSCQSDVFLITCSEHPGILSCENIYSAKAEMLFNQHQDLFSSLELVFFDTTSIYFEGQGGESIGHFGKTKDWRPDLKQMVVGGAAFWTATS